MPFDPALPANGSLISAVELRNQLTSLRDMLQTRASLPTVTSLTQTISNPPTQAQVLAIQNTVNTLIEALTVLP